MFGIQQTDFEETNLSNFTELRSACLFDNVLFLVLTFDEKLW